MQNSLASDGDLDRGATRAAILSAARAVAQRDGAENLTLSKVATEAGLPRAAVYRQFTRKEDMLMSIVSDDLGTLARKMRGIEWPETDNTPDAAVPRATPMDTKPESETAVEATNDVSAGSMPASEIASGRKLARRAEFARVPDAQSTTTTPLSAKGEAAPAAAEPLPADKSPARADQWLERRLRVFEKGMVAMETRQEQVEKNARAVVAEAEAQIKSLEESVKELTARAEAAEARHKTSSNEVRAALNETTLRIQTVEGVTKAALSEYKAPAEATLAPEAIAELEWDEPAEKSELEPEGPVHAERTPSAAPAKPDPLKSKIAEVRASVAAATAVAAVTAEARKDARVQRAKRERTRYLLAGLIVLAVFIAAATMAFSKGVADGRSDALHHANRRVARMMPTASTVAPLDRLTARAQAGDAAAEYVVASRYLAGDGTPKNPVGAIHWLSLAAAKGLPAAQYMLGTLYTQGMGTKADAAKALRWYEAAALQGNRKAMHALAIAYAQGTGTTQNMPEAIRWFSRAAQLGYVDSQFNLAVLYERGDGVPQSLLDAYKWYVVASRNGDGESKERVATLRTQLNADDLAAAEHAAASFQPAPFNMAANVAP